MTLRAAIVLCLLCLVLPCLSAGSAAQAGDSRHLMPTVTGPLPDLIRLNRPAALENRKLAAMGLADVTAAPFFADPGGRRDSTAALQRAIDFARDHQMVCFFPEGTYRVSDTLSCAQPLYLRTSGKAHDGRYFPCVLMGSRAGRRPRILLSGHSPGFGDPAHPKYVIHFWARSIMDETKPQPNISWNQMLVNLDVGVEPGNPGAVGIRHRAAQGSGIQDCTVDVTHGLTGIEGGIGSGGSMAGVTVIGGRVGLDLRQTQPAPTIAGITLRGQSEHAVFYAGRQSLSAVGLSIEYPGAEAAIETHSIRGNPHHGELCLVDGVIRLERADATAIHADSSLYLENVRVSGGQAAVSGPGGNVLIPGGGQGGVNIGRFALGVDPRPWQGYHYTGPVMVDGKELEAPLFKEGKEAARGPAEHLWPKDFPGFESPGAVNVRQAPYSARGDGTGDDTRALQAAIDAADTVFLPKGVYRISKPLLLRPGTRLVGVAKHLSLITPVPEATAFADLVQPAPLVRTADTDQAATVVAFLGLHVPMEMAGCTALDWRSGGDSILRDVEFPNLPLKGYRRPGPAAVRNQPLVLVEGHGGGRWYNFYLESYAHHGPDYRHLLVRGTSGPLSLYQCNPEHAQGEANMEIAESSNVAIYGLKGEANQPVLRIRDSRRVGVYGYGGNAAGRKDKSLFEIIRSSGLVLAGLVDSPRLEGEGDPKSLFGTGMHPAAWRMVLEYDGQGAVVRGSAPMARPAAYILTEQP